MCYVRGQDRSLLDVQLGLACWGKRLGRFEWSRKGASQKLRGLVGNSSRPFRGRNWILRWESAAPNGLHAWRPPGCKVAQSGVPRGYVYDVCGCVDWGRAERSSWRAWWTPMALGVCLLPSRFQQIPSPPWASGSSITFPLVMRPSDVLRLN